MCSIFYKYEVMLLTYRFYLIKLYRLTGIIDCDYCFCMFCDVSLY